MTFKIWKKGWPFWALVILISACGNSGGVGPVSVVRPEDSPKPSFIAFASVEILEPEEVPPVTTAVISPSEVSVAPGQILILGAHAYDAAGQVVSNVAIEWRVVNDEAGRITETGLFFAGDVPGSYPQAIEMTVRQETGEDTITLSSRANVTITPSRGERILSFVGVYPSTIQVRPGQFVGLGTLGWDSQGRFIPGLDFQWSVLNPNAGTIDKFGFFTAGTNSGNYPNAVRVRAVQNTPRGDVIRENYVSVSIGQSAPAGILESVEIIPHSVFLEKGGQTHFLARAFDGNSQQVSNVLLEWKMRIPQAGEIDEGGHFTSNAQAGHFSGAVEVTATQTTPAGQITVTETANVTILEPSTPDKLYSAHVIPSNVTLKPRQKIIFNATAFDNDGNEVPVDDIQWEVVDGRAGVIDEVGVFTASDKHGIYNSAVRLRVSKDGGEAKTTVVDYATVSIVGELDRVVIEPPKVKIQPGQAVLFQVKGFDVNGLNVGPLRVFWSVENPEAGTIDASGIFTAGDRPGEYPQAIKIMAAEP